MLPTNVKALRSGAFQTRRQVEYVQPSLGELMGLCRDFKLISEIKVVGDRYQIQYKDEQFDVTASQAALLVKGLLIGHFAFHTRDDLSLANWAH